MTTATFKQDSLFRTLTVNGRRVYVRRIESIAKEGGYTFKGQADGGDFEIFGGLASGGTARQWFVKWATLGDFWMDATSMVDAVSLIENS